MTTNEEDKEGKNDGTEKKSMETNMTMSSGEIAKLNEEHVTAMASRTASSISLNKETDDLKTDEINATEEGGMLKQLEASSKGQVSGSLLLNYFKSSNQPCMLVILLAAFLLAQALASIADVWVSYWYEPILYFCFNKSKFR